MVAQSGSSYGKDWHLQSVEERISSLGYELPEVRPIGNYVPAKKIGNDSAGYTIFMSGQIPFAEGKAGKDFTLSHMQELARTCTLRLIAAMKNIKVDLEKVEIVKVGVFVNCETGYGQQPEVANAASDLLVEVFGERGRHARAAVGSNDLPRENAIEIEMIAYEPSKENTVPPHLFESIGIF